MNLRVRSTANAREKATQYILQIFDPCDNAKRDVFVWLPNSQIKEVREPSQGEDPQGHLESIVAIPEWLGKKKVKELASKMSAIPSDYIVKGC